MEIPHFKGEMLKNEPMSGHTSFAIGGPADILAYPADRDDLLLLLRAIRSQGAAYCLLGGGTNLLVRDGGFRGVVISLRRMNAVSMEREYRSIGGYYGVVSVEAGVFLPKLISYVVSRGYRGLEFAAGIPGTIGGAICMNAGTALGEIGDIVESVGLLSPEGALVTRSGEELEFGYRTASIPEGHLVLEARLLLRRDENKKIKARMTALLDVRKKHQPWGLPNAGSIFKNPREESAGRLIDSAGLKGRTVGDAQVSEKHANFIVNLGRAKAADVIALMEVVERTVLAVRGVRLEPEIKIIGEDS
jgi:UDP-N-acetylmuramate dehydrogenase